MIPTVPAPLPDRVFMIDTLNTPANSEVSRACSELLLHGIIPGRPPKTPTLG